MVERVGMPIRAEPWPEIEFGGHFRFEAVPNGGCG